MDGWLFARGLLIGLAIAAPVGPIGVLVIRRTLADGWATGVATGMGVATADALYGCVAAFGLTAITNLLLGAQGAIRLLGGLFLCYLGVRTLLAKPATHAASSTGAGLLAAYGSTLLLTLTNPLTILSFLAILAGVGLGSGAGKLLAATVLVLGVFIGSALWWLLLAGATNLLRHYVTPGRLRWVNGISGLIVLMFGVVALVGA